MVIIEVLYISINNIEKNYKPDEYKKTSYKKRQEREKH